MKKYKLLKDLPTWKSGEEFILKEDGNLYGIDGEKEIMVYFSKTLSKFDILNNKEWLEEVIEKPNSVFDLKIGDEYFFFNGAGFHRCVERREIDGDYEMRFYRDRLYYGNVFLTEKEERKELNKRIAIQKIKRYCWENGIKLADKEFFVNKNNNKIYIVYDTILQGFHFVFSNIYFYDNFLAFKDTEDAKQVIKDCESDLKIIFDIE